MSAKNINSLKYFLNRWETVDPEYNYTVPYHDSIDPHFTSLPTFVAEFFDCRTHSCPLLITNEDHLITNHVWNLTHKSRHKPSKTHGLWEEWGDVIKIDLPPGTKQFNETYTYVWLPIDEDSAENPWHIWIDVISKFRLIEKRWSTNFAKYVFILSNPSKYFDKVAEEFFPELKYIVMPKDETWQFKHLIVPSLSNHNDGITTPHLAPWLRSMRNILKVTPEAKKKIFISREDAQNRKIINQNELLMTLKGWETITLDNLSIKEQVKIFAGATHVVAPHGAGLANLLWCNPNTKVYELTHREFLGKKVYPTLSKHLGLEHRIILCDTVKINEAKSKNKKTKDMVDLKIDITELIKILN